MTAQHHYTVTANARQHLAIGAFFPVVFHLPSNTQDEEENTAAAIATLQFMGYEVQNVERIEEGPPFIVYFSKDGKPNVYDQIRTDENRSFYGRKTLEEIHQQHPDAQLMGWTEYNRLHNIYWTSDPIEITEEQFSDALECLPPVRWTNTPEGESFKMSERLSGNITGIYCRIESRFFCFNGPINTHHAAALEKCRAAMTTAGA